MNEKNKSPKGIKIIAGLMFVGGLVLGGWVASGVAGVGLDQLHIYLIEFSICAIISMSSLIASIGLWKMKRWGLFASYFGLGISISIATIQAIIILILKEVPGVIGVDYRLEVLFWYVPPIFIGSSILYYLFTKRRCFS